ncbi:TPA: efflux RND transporter periplasmic adaptor subunit [Legionella pneumophila]|uniref:efflux RND transporter periplasmic adaptor subunit n=1 Tax=Legionella TaxID=445 RepID=UPI00037D9579|nr:efflux RND transporter periplasmic adaptor subunit [Legionella anisa]
MIKLQTKQTFWLASVTTAILITVLFYYNKRTEVDENNYILSTLKQGLLIKKITATGTINPKKVISVGTQVSGIVEDVFVDENSVVKKNMVLAVLDKKIFSNDVQKRRAVLDKMKARLELTKIRLERMQKLIKNKFISAEDLDIKIAEQKIEESDYALAQANFEQALIQIKYADILSPIDGVVMERLVEPGQTVAASFTTPVLFKIAENMTDMQIRVKISELDIPLTSINQKATFTVSSFPGKIFQAYIEKIMLNPNIEQGVVTYDVLMKVNNKDNLLRPGMSADISIELARIDNAQYVSSDALRFTPPEFKKRDLHKKYIYLLEKGQIVPVEIETGIENDEYTQILGGNINKNQKIILGIDDHEPH